MTTTQSSISRPVVYLGGGDERDGAGDPVLKFRLTYHGNVRPTQTEQPRGGLVPLAAHKHAIRKAFHIQLKQLWETDRFLREAEVYWTEFGQQVPEEQKDQGRLAQGRLSAVLPNLYQQYGYRFLPLVCERFQLLCSLDILFLRRDIPGSALNSGDIDNRVKTLIDALRRPRNALELVGNEQPSDGEDPFYCLLEDDSQVSRFAVETDILLEPATAEEADVAKANVIVTVELRPYHVTLFNMSFG